MTIRHSFRDIELLSAHLDGELRQADVTRLEARLKADPQLRSELEDLRQIRTLLRSTPRQKIPRNFTLTPKMAGLRAPTPRSVPVLRWAAALATVLLAVTFVANYAAPLGGALRSAAPYGVGGGAAEDSEQVVGQEMVMEATPPEQEFAAPATSLDMATKEAEAEEGILPTPTGMQALERAPEALAENQAQGSEAGLFPIAWQLGLAAFALLCAILVLLIRWNAQRKLARQTKREDSPGRF